MQTFEFKPAVLRSRSHWTLDSGLLTRNGQPFCDLGQVTQARYAEMSVRRTHSEWFELGYPGGRHRIACNMWPGDPHNTEFRKLCAAILSKLADRKPDLQVVIGAGGGVRWAMFLIGALSALFGLGVLLSIFMGGVNDGKVAFALLFSSGFILFGVWLGWAYRPWAPPLLMPVSAARDMLLRLAMDEKPATDQAQA